MRSLSAHWAIPLSNVMALGSARLCCKPDRADQRGRGGLSIA